MYFMKNIREMIGKVILDAKEKDDMILLKLTGDEYLIIVARAGYGGDYAEFEIDDYGYLDLDDRVDFGFITKEESRKIEEEKYKEWKREREEEELETLKKLKDKYGNV